MQFFGTKKNDLTKDLLTPELLGHRHRCLVPEFERPHAKSASKMLVLEFDQHGTSYLREMHRLDVLHLTRQAADEMVITEEGKRKNTELSGSKGFCDVQNVHMRDLRKLDAAFTASNEPSFMIRKQAILVNADPIRAIILRHSCLVFVPDGADSLLSRLKEGFQDPEDPNIPFEFRAIEAILNAISRTLISDLDQIIPAVTLSLGRLENVQMSSGELETLRSLKNTVNEYDSQVAGVERALTELLDNAEDLKLLHLTKLYNNPDLIHRLEEFDSEDSEILLEAYLQEINTMRAKVGLLHHRIQNTESLIMLKLDAVRNYLLSANAVFGLVSMCITFGMFVTGAFGMNLKSNVEDVDGWFWGVVSFTTGLSIVVTILGLAYFRHRGLIML